LRSNKDRDAGPKAESRLPQVDSTSDQGWGYDLVIRLKVCPNIAGTGGKRVRVKNGFGEKVIGDSDGESKG
jgi:hypothetical protein